MEQAYFRFYAGLNDFLPPEKRQVTFAYAFKGPVSVKHLIESIGVPHTEVEIILANGQSVDFSYLVQGQDRIAVYPSFGSLDVSSLLRVRPPFPNPYRFLLDNHLGRLARYLRLLGFDALYPHGMDDEQLAHLAHQEKRILLTRDRGLLKRSRVTYGYCLRTKNSKEQVRAVLQRFDLFDAISPWERCLRCNGRLQPIAKEAILHRLEPKTKRYFHEFNICQSCGQIYWKGSHYQRLEQFINNITSQAPS